MKALTLTELVKVLSTPDAQPMGTLMDACKQAAQFIRNEKVIYEKGAAFAKLFADPKFDTIDAATLPEPESPVREGSRPVPAAALRMVSGQCNIFISGVRPVKGKQINRVEILRVLREASGELNAAPRMTLQKANELISNLELGDQATLIRTVPQMEEASEIVKELAAVGILAEIRN